ncbi:Der GTPase-activating protein YihI [Caenorhabditis elegans]|uniref:Der GTPase-activating protein YihI n=1 Tax=Caenorhabditis elegans TaxID=6239 RepID=Q09960_CAEEL|nr:Der GTPase-activating protein YihI [Caenorhabditis elegans]CCD65022.1 Der GTPase-activating protein YihI [Caenorhabditis elegans]|eukprot:NP_495130.1 Uncharacterized protein CELE_C18A3.7 [Caenorhabditis elegans]
MDKGKGSKRSTPSLRAKKKTGTDRQKPSVKQNASQNSKKSSRQKKTPSVGKEREQATDKKREIEKKPQEKTALDEQQRKAQTETISNLEILPDKNPAKMDDGYEDFGPGAAAR